MERPSRSVAAAVALIAMMTGFVQGAPPALADPPGTVELSELREPSTVRVWAATEAGLAYVTDSAAGGAAQRLLVEDGVLLRKYWFSVSDDEQEKRFRSRLDDPMRRWKLSPMDLESISRWEDYSRAKDEMFVHTDIPEAPWYVVESDDKRAARLNMIAHLLSTLPYHDVERPPLELPPRPPSEGYTRPPRNLQTHVSDHASEFRAEVHAKVHAEVNAEVNAERKGPHGRSDRSRRSGL